MTSGLVCTRDTLAEALNRAVSAADSPHVDLGPMLHASTPVRIGFDDVHALLESGEPAFSLEVGDAALTVRRQDGGMMAELEIKW